MKERRSRAEKTMLVRLPLLTPPQGFGRDLREMLRWLDETVGRGGYQWLPSGMRLPDAVHLFLPDLVTAQAFAERWPVVGIEVTREGGTEDEARGD
ncbi:hypothetical protein F2P47_07520 [Parvibaculum sedimenti]|uniref:Uncharacterized protein n=1 Tax=Parvibaculum sedimenti TaxID=2608632 RepID=A0A6N6VHT6_9HYPH|nr:hypothetical protein [Parvibaculum sedimenti]KAB7740373.1 hypothetical protein F2P47_07520 [Parvibaculum sedimenti]